MLPLLWGGATPFGVMVVRLVALTAFLLFLAVRHQSRELGELRGPLGALLLVALFGFLQSAAWPRKVVEVLSPSHAALADEAALATGTEPLSWIPLSLSASASRGVALDCLVFAALAIAALQVGRRRSWRRWLAAAIVGSACLQVLLGLRPWLAGLVPRLRGTYANPDHLCILLEIAACVALAGIFWALSSRRWADRGELRAAGALSAGVLLLVMLSAISFTGSRAAIPAVLIGLTAQAAASARERGKWPLAVLGLAGLGSASFLAWIGVGRSFGRLASTSWFDIAWGSRSLVWSESFSLIRRFPLLGSGLGTFESAFPLVQPAGLEGVRWGKAHNDFLELAVTGGLVGFTLGAAGVVFLLIALSRKLRSAGRTEDRLAPAAALGCLIAVGVHETFDFGLSLAANAFILIAVVAAALGVRVKSRQ